MLTDWIVAQVGRLAPSPFSNEARQLIRTYARPNPEADHQHRELALVVGYALLIIPTVGLWALLALGCLGGG